MNPDIFLYFSISCFSLCLILIIFSSFKNSKKVRDIKIPINQFVSKVLEWCSSNIGSHKQGYQVDLKYYRNNEFAGYYFNHTRTIQIFVYDELDLLDLTEIIIHEYIHHIQYSNNKTYSEYKKYQRDVGYWNNPFEIEARKLSKIHKNQCYEDVVNSKIVV